MNLKRLRERDGLGKGVRLPTRGPRMQASQRPPKGRGSSYKYAAFAARG